MLVEKLPIAFTKARKDSAFFLDRGIAWLIIILPNPDQAAGHDWLGHRDATESRRPLDVSARFDIPFDGRVFFRQAVAKLKLQRVGIAAAFSNNRKLGSQ